MTDQPDKDGSSTNANNLYALLIGIDGYLPNHLPGGYYYPQLHGCVSDTDVAQQFLSDVLKIPASNITRLTATNNGQAEPPEPREKWPTYANIIGAFQQLTGKCRKGDRLYIHYSGHGGRTPTILPAIKGANGLDETLVPVDIGNSTERYVRDVELARLLGAMVDKGIEVTIVLDSCHSGGATRAISDGAVRGIGVVDTTDRPADSLAGTLDELAASWQRQTPAASRSIQAANPWLPDPQGYVLIAACEPAELANEYPFSPEKSNGALTYFLLDALRTSRPGLTYQDVANVVINQVHAQFPTQTPVLAGQGNREVFGSRLLESPLAATVQQVDMSRNLVTLNVGQSANYASGTQFAIYPPATTDFSDLTRRLALVTITNLRAAESDATITTRLSEQDISPGALAVPVDLGAARLYSAVKLDLADPLLGTVTSALQQSAAGWVRVVPGDQTCDFRIVVNQAGELELQDPSYSPLPNLRPALRADDPGAPAILAARLVHLSKYRNVQRLDNADPASPLANKLTLTISLPPANYDPEDASTVPVGQPVTSNPVRLAVNAWALATVKNSAAGKTLYCAVLDLAPDWSISIIYPTGLDNLSLDPGQAETFRLRATLPDGYATGRDILKVIATVEPTSFSFLELPALDQPPAPRTRGDAKGTSNAMEALMNALTADQPPTRASAEALPTTEWTVVHVEIQTG